MIKQGCWEPAQYYEIIKAVVNDVSRLSEIASKGGLETVSYYAIDLEALFGHVCL